VKKAMKNSLLNPLSVTSDLERKIKMHLNLFRDLPPKVLRRRKRLRQT
jgi:hypothetical protein